MNTFTRILKWIEKRKTLVIIATLVLFTVGMNLYSSGYFCFSGSEEIDSLSVQWQRGIGVCSDGEYLWVANESQLSVQKVEPASGAVVATVDVGGQAYGMAYDGKYIWVSVRTGDLLRGKLVKIDAETLKTKVAGSIIPGIDGYGDLYYDGKYLWVGTNGISKVCRSNSIVIKDRLVNGDPSFITSDGSYIWAVHDSFLKIDPASDNILDSIGMIGGNVGGTLLFDGRDLWYYHGHLLYWLDLDASGNPGEITEFDPQVFGGTACTDGNYLWMVDIESGSVAEFNIETKEVTRIIEVDFGSGSITATITYDGSDVWVVNRVNGEIVKLNR